jgi:hypothetical protein
MPVEKMTDSEAILEQLYGEQWEKLREVRSDLRLCRVHNARMLAQIGPPPIVKALDNQWRRGMDELAAQKQRWLRP